MLIPTWNVSVLSYGQVSLQSRAPQICFPEAGVTVEGLQLLNMSTSVWWMQLKCFHGAMEPRASKVTYFYCSCALSHHLSHLPPLKRNTFKVHLKKTCIVFYCPRLSRIHLSQSNSRELSLPEAGVTLPQHVSPSLPSLSTPFMHCLLLPEAGSDLLFSLSPSLSSYLLSHSILPCSSFCTTSFRLLSWVSLFDCMNHHLGSCAVPPRSVSFTPGLRVHSILYVMTHPPTYITPSQFWGIHSFCHL